MTTQAYTQYQARVARFFKEEGINNLTTDYEKNGEAFFSWQPCDCCGSRLGGNREKASGYNPTTKEVQEYERVCLDCIYYVEYGQLDDLTMLDMAD